MDRYAILQISPNRWRVIVCATYRLEDSQIFQFANDTNYKMKEVAASEAKRRNQEWEKKYGISKD